jgi:integrase
VVLNEPDQAHEHLGWGWLAESSRTLGWHQRPGLAPSDDTKPMNAAFLRFKVWYRLVRRAEVRAIRIHDLRHTYASLLLLAGELMLYVKEQLGDSTVQVTVDFYGYIRPGLNRGAVNRLAEATRSGAPWNYTMTTLRSGDAVRTFRK